MKLGERGGREAAESTPGALKPRQRLPAKIAAKVRKFLARDKHRVPRSVQPLNPGFALLERMRAQKTMKVRSK